MRIRYVCTGMRSRARQRGAIGVLGSLVLALGVLFMALSVDSGRLLLEQRRLQNADSAALDASRALCGAAAADLAAVRAAAQASALRNGYGAMWAPSPAPCKSGTRARTPLVYGNSRAPPWSRPRRYR